MKKRSKLMTITVITLICIVLIASTISFIKFFRTATENAPKEMIHFTSAQSGLEFDYPKNWYIADLPDGNHGDKDVRIVISSITQSPYIEFSKREFENSTYDEIVCWGINKSTQKRKVFAITDTTNVCSSNLEKFEYYDLRENVFGRKAFHCIDYFRSSNNHGYMFSFCSKEDEWESLKNIFMQIHDSIIIR